MDGSATGQIIQGVRALGSVAGGCDMYIDAMGNMVIAYLVSTRDDMPAGGANGDGILVEMYGTFNYGSSYGGSDIGFDSEPFIGNSDWNVTLANGGSNPLNAAILFRGSGIEAGSGPVFPGINNCELLVSHIIFRNMGAFPLVGGEASFNQNLPDDANLIGVEATFQWLLPTGIGVLPFDLSDAGTIRVGTNL